MPISLFMNGYNVSRNCLIKKNPFCVHSSLMKSKRNFTFLHRSIRIRLVRILNTPWWSARALLQVRWHYNNIVPYFHTVSQLNTYTDPLNLQKLEEVLKDDITHVRAFVNYYTSKLNQNLDVCNKQKPRN